MSEGEIARESLEQEIKRLRRENDGLSDMIRTGGGQRRSTTGAFLLGVAVGAGLMIVLLATIFWQSGPIIRMF